MKPTFAPTLLLLTALAPAGLPAQDDTILRAMKDELDRSRALRIVDLDPPYFIEYSMEDADSYSVSASLGGLLGASRRPVRALDVRVRVGSYDFDNTNYVLSGFRAGGGGEDTPVPMDNSYLALRQSLWLETDSAFKTAEEALGRKRSALKNINVPEQLPDYSKAPAVQSVLPLKRHPIDDEAWKTRVVKLSEIFSDFPQIVSSVVDFEALDSTTYMSNSEGSVLREPDNLAYLRVRAWAQAEDGMSLRNSDVIPAPGATDLPGEAEMRQRVTRVATDLAALTHAPQGDVYSGPVLFEPLAAAQLVAQVLGDNLKITRRPVPQPGRTAPYIGSELEAKIGSRIFPDWIDIVDDPTQSIYHGRALSGSYLHDDEGVRAEPIALVEKGVLKNFLLTRTPALKNFLVSNGRGRLHGNYGATAPSFGNLFVHAGKSVSPAELKQQLIQLCKDRNKPYGLLIRKLDFPSSASFDELRRLFSSISQSGDGARPVSLPLLVYRVYPDGREELVRGLRFHGLTTRAFKDIAAASNDEQVFSFLDNTFPFALMGAGGYISPSSIIAPGLLFEDVDLERTTDQLPKLPIVPPPSLEPAR
jgi:hypothetical protein